MIPRRAMHGTESKGIREAGVTCMSGLARASVDETQAREAGALKWLTRLGPGELKKVGPRRLEKVKPGR